MKQLLWLKFYPKDWNGDHNLRACSLAARGLLASFLEPMHTAEPYGHLLLRGKKPDYAELATLASCKLREVKYGIEELVNKGVLSVRPDGILYSRRMVRDAERAQKRSKDGKNGGNPALVPHDPVVMSQALTVTEVNHTLKGDLKPIESRVQSPEARVQSDAETPARTPDRRTTRTAALVPYAAHRNHAICGLICLPSALFEEFVKRARHQVDPDAYVTAFVRTWEQRYVEGDRKTHEISGDAFEFWRKRWTETHPATDAKPVVDVTAKALERLQRDQARYGVKS